MLKPDIEAIKATNPILQVLRDLGIQAQHQRIRCPRPERHSHGDRTPSVSVWPDRGQFKCWVCHDVKGDVIDLVRLIKNCGFQEALDFLQRDAPKSAAASSAGNNIPSLPVSPPHLFPTHHHAHHWPAASPDQTELFQPPTAPASRVSSSIEAKQSSSEEKPIPSSALDALSPASMDTDTLKLAVLESLLKLSAPLRGKAARYLQKRRIFKRTWDAQGLRVIEDYAGVSRELLATYGLDALERTGFFNQAGHLRYYRHRLLFPYFDWDGRAVYMQARAIEAEVTPKELSLPGHVPLPYNCRLLDGQPGLIYLCEGIIDTLTLLEQGFPAVGVPGAAHFKPAWTGFFKNKTVHLVFDADTAGDAGAEKTLALLAEGGVEAHRLKLPEGEDINDWFRGKK